MLRADPRAPVLPLVALCLAVSACSSEAARGAGGGKAAPGPLARGLETPSYKSPYTRDENGDTVIKPVTEGLKTTRKIYVSSSTGSDDNDGLSPQTPVKSLTRGRDLLRPDHPDHLLLKRGDVFEENLWLNGVSGLGPGQPVLISGYGEGPRPHLKVGKESGLGLSPAHEHKHLAIVGLKLEAHLRNPATPGYDPTQEGFDDAAGINGTTRGEDILVEDCELSYFSSGVVVQNLEGLIKGVELRRNIIHHAWSMEGMPQGIYTYNVDGLLIEENLIDEVGYLEAAGKAGTMFNHAMYLQNMKAGLRANPGLHTVVRGNFVARSDGIQARDGGLIEKNFFYRAWIGLLCGGGNDSTIGGAFCVVRDNTFYDGGDISPDEPRGWGLVLRNLRPPSRVLRNTFVHNQHGHGPSGIELDASHRDDHGRPQRIRSLRLQENVLYRWGAGLDLYGDGRLFGEVELVDNIIELAKKAPAIRHTHESQLARVRAAGNRVVSGAGADEVIQVGSASFSVEEWNKRVGPQGATLGPTPLLDPTRNLERYAREVAGLDGVLALLAEARKGLQGAHGARLRGSAVAPWVAAGYRPPGATREQGSVPRKATPSKEQPETSPR